MIAAASLLIYGVWVGLPFAVMAWGIYKLWTWARRVQNKRRK